MARDEYERVTMRMRTAAVAAARSCFAAAHADVAAAPTNLDVN
jgi:hypothetical protein